MPKISELEDVTILSDGCCFPMVSHEETRKLSYGALKERLTEDYNFGELAFKDEVNADEVPFDNRGTTFESQNVEDAIKELGEYVASGKRTVALAITNKGVPTESDATFETLANNVGMIHDGMNARIIEPLECTLREDIPFRFVYVNGESIATVYYEDETYEVPKVVSGMTTPIDIGAVRLTPYATNRYLLQIKDSDYIGFYNKNLYFKETTLDRNTYIEQLYTANNDVEFEMKFYKYEEE